MDWRLGVALLRSLYDSTYAALANSTDIESDISSLPADHEMSDWLIEAGRQRDLMMALDPDMVPGNLNGLPVLFDNRRDKEMCHVFVHPLWRLDDSGGSPGAVVMGANEEFWRSPLKDHWSNPKINWVDTFNGSRRISLCRVNLRSE